MNPSPHLSRGAEDSDAFTAGLHTGYAHGYEIGLAHGRAHPLDDPDTEPGRRPRLFSGPDRDELIARGHIVRDLTRPPALPARMWDADDWAKAGVRDLPTTEHGRAQWRAALAAGRVPATLAAAFTAQNSERQPKDTTNTSTPETPAQQGNPHDDSTDPTNKSPKNDPKDRSQNHPQNESQTKINYRSHQGITIRWKGTGAEARGLTAAALPPAAAPRGRWAGC